MQEEGEGQGPQPGARGGAAQARAKVRERQGPPRGVRPRQEPGVRESKRVRGPGEAGAWGGEGIAPGVSDFVQLRPKVKRTVPQKVGTGLATSNGPKTWFVNDFVQFRPKVKRTVQKLSESGLSEQIFAKLIQN